MILRKLIISFFVFVVICAVLALAGGMISYSLTEGGAPEARQAAAATLVSEWGPAYPAGIMLVSAMITILGLATGKLPGLGERSGEKTGVIVK